MAYSWKDNLPDGGAIPENSAGDPLATLTADDGTTDAVSYGIGAGSDGYGNALFKIDNNGVLSPKTMPADYLDDYEDSILVQYRADRLFTATVNAYSAEGEVVASRLFVLTLQDVNEVNWVQNPAIYGDNGTIAENTSPDTVLAVFSAYEEDANATIEYSLDESATDATFFNIDASTGELTAKSAFNFEHASHDNSYHIRVIANSDDASLSVTQDFRITITNVDEGVEWQTNPTGNAGEVLENMAIGTSVANFGSSDPEGAGLAYYGLGSDYGFDGGHQDAYFKLDLQTGELTTNSELNFEEFTHYTILALSQAAVGDKGVAEHTFILTLGDVADETLEWVSTPSTVGRKLAENDTTTTTIADFGATDTVDATPLTYSLSGTDSADFAIDAATGILSTAGPFNFEDADHTDGLYSVIITATATDGTGTPAISRRYVLTITDVDEQVAWQTAPTGNAGEVLETIAIGTSVADFDAIDPEGAGTAYYGLGSDYGFDGGHQDAYFNLDLSTGELTTNSVLDFEEFTHYTILALSQAAEGNKGVASQLFILTITDQDIEWESGGNPTGNAIAENNPAATLVADFGASDTTDNSTLTYSLAAGGDSANFAIDAATGELSTSASFNFEDSHDPRYSVVVIATETDAAAGAVSQTFILTINDVDEQVAWQTAPTGNAGEVLETIAIGTSVADFDAIDPEGGAAYYGLGSDYGFDSGHQDAYFNLDLQTGELTTKSLLDFETQDHYTILALSQAGDGNKGVASELFILTITDVNEDAAWVSNPAGIAIAENNPENFGPIVFNAVDGDGADVTYSLEPSTDTAPNDADYFSLDADTGELRVKSVLDFENPDHGITYSVIINATSLDDSPTISHTFILTVTNIDEQVAWQTGGNPTGNTISENIAIGTSVADFDAIDPEGAGTAYYGLGSDYGFDGGHQDAYFNLDLQTGELTTKSALDFENNGITNGHYTILALSQAAQGNKGVISELFILTITDTSEFPVAWNEDNGNPSGAALTENNAVGISLADFGASDGDNGDGNTVLVTYSLSGDDTAYFNIDATNGVLTAKSAFDFEDGNHADGLYSVVVNANSTDDSPAISQVFVLTVSNVNDNPTTWQTGGNPSGATLSENNAVGVTVVDFNATDGDGGAVTYSLSGADTDYFSLDTTTGVLTAKSVFDFENGNHGTIYSVVVNANSLDDSPAISQLYVLTITNTSEFLVVWEDNGNPSGAVLAENNSIGVSLADFSATDGDLLAVTYSLSGTDATYFNLNTTTGVLTAKSAFDFEDGAFYSVVINASSLDDSPVMSQLFILTLNNVAEPTAWENNGNPVGNTINEGLAIGTSLADFNATDGDNVGISYSVAADLGDGSYFAINSTTGVLTAKSIFDFENPDKTDGRYSVLVRANSDDDSDAVSQIFVLTITDVNNTTAFSAGGGGLTISENNVVGFDAGDRITDYGNDGATVSITYGLSGDAADYFSIVADTGWLFITSVLDFESDYGQANNNLYSIIIHANANVEGDAVSQKFVLTVADVDTTRGWADGTPDGITLSENLAIGVEVVNINALSAAPGGGSIIFGISGTDANYFNINQANGIITFASVLDFENPANADNRYSIIIHSNATTEGTEITRNFVLTITDVNNTNDWASDTTTGKALNENRDVPIALDHFTNNGTLPSGVTMTYAITGGDTDYFNIELRSNGQWRLNATSSFDYESEYGQSINNRYSVIITANATEEGTAISRTYILTVGDVNESPQWSSDPSTGGTLAENNAANHGLVSFYATDGDGAAVTYSLSGTDAAYFTTTPFNGGSGVYAKSSFNFEDSTHTDGLYSVIITATATDDSPAALSQLYVLTITDGDEPTAWQTNGNPVGNTISENLAIGTSLADFNATDYDSGATVSYWVEAGLGDGSYFAIDSASGVLTTTSSFDFENPATANATNRYSVLVRANSDDDSPVITQIFVLTIADANESPEWSVAPATGTTFAENNAVGLGPIPFNATDDGGGTVTYSLSGTDAAYFSIDADNGGLYAASSFDFEDSGHTDGLYTITVNATATDDNPIALSHTFVLTITNAEEPTTWQTNGNPVGNTISENLAIGTSLADFNATDFDGTTISYSVAADLGDGSYFAIDSASGVLTAKSIFDFETPDKTDGRYSVLVRANSDDASDAITQIFVLTITNIDKTTAFTAGGNGLTISENNVVGFDAGDRIDDFGNAATPSGVAITYSLSGDAADYFSIAATTGWLFITSSLDFESDYGQANNNRYSVMITANADNEGTAITQLYILSVGNINEPTTWVSNPTAWFIGWSENKAPHTFRIGLFSAKDEDNSPISYYISSEGDEANYFSINSTGELWMASAFDFESETAIHNNNRYSLTIHAVTADGNDSISTPQVFILTITDATTGPTEAFTWSLGDSNNGGFATAEDLATGLLTGFPTTGHANITPIYSLSGVDAAYFNINSIGRLYSVSLFDYESTYGQSINNRYSIVVKATDSNDANNAISFTHILTITNLDEVYWQNNGNPSGVHLQENNATGASLADFGATAESGDTVTYSLTASNPNNPVYFNLDGTTGVLRAGVRFNYEDFNSQARNFKYSVTIHAHSTNDENDGAIAQNFILTVTDIEDGEYIQGGGLAPDPTTPDQPVGLNGKILFDGDTDNLGGINDGIGNDGLAIIGNDLSVTQYDSVSATNTDLIINNVENFEQSFVGYTDADGNEQNHWFFVRDDADDNTGHIVFDADGLDVNLESLANGGATTTPDQINLLAGLNFNNDGDFNKPDDLDLNLNGNNAASLTHDQFLALIGGSNNIDFI